MALRFIDLCNRTLRRLNEVEIAEPEFLTVRGIQSYVKDAVNDAVASINQAQFEWPFNAAEETGTLTVGQTEYSVPSSFQSMEWESFQIVPSDGVSQDNKRLTYIDRDVWVKDFRDKDDNAVAEGLGTPIYVFRAHGNGFGVSPAPDQAYRIQFRYYLNFSRLVDANDTTRVPDDFEKVIIDGAIYQMYLFKDNTDNAAAAYENFQLGLKALRSIYINTYERIRDTRVNFGGGVARRSM